MVEEIKRRGTYRHKELTVEPVPEKETFAEKVSATAEKADFNFPKTITGVVLAGAAVGIKVFVPVVPFMELLFVTGITTAAAGVGIKLDRVKKGDSAWKHEIAIWNKIIGRTK